MPPDFFLIVGGFLVVFLILCGSLAYGISQTSNKH
jgi:hypothetical protein